jgi:hypothetical protein
MFSYWRIAMTEDERDLYNRISSFEFDEPGAEFTFSARLARENGWTRRFAARVIDEYKKFAFLAMTAGHSRSDRSCR